MTGNEFVRNHNKQYSKLVKQALNNKKEESNMKNVTYRKVLKEELQDIAADLADQLMCELNYHEEEAIGYYDREDYYKEPISEREMLQQVVHMLNIIAYGKTN